MTTQQTLEAHVKATYLYLRRGMSTIALLFPFSLWLGGKGVFNLPLQSSMSAYYYTEMRDVFVGILWAIGIFLFLYKGLEGKSWLFNENWKLNVAGICACLIALFSMDSGKVTTFHGVVHYVSAGIFFTAIAACAWWPPTILDASLSEERRQRYRWWQRFCGVGMVLCIVAAVVYYGIYFLKTPDQREADTGYWVFGIEFVAIEVFCLYWFWKSKEMDHAVPWVPAMVKQQYQSWT